MSFTGPPARVPVRVIPNVEHNRPSLEPLSTVSPPGGNRVLDGRVAPNVVGVLRGGGWAGRELNPSPNPPVSESWRIRCFPLRAQWLLNGSPRLSPSGPAGTEKSESCRFQTRTG